MNPTLQNGWRTKYFKFQKEILNGKLERLVYIEAPEHVSYGTELTRKVLEVKRILYVLKDAAQF